MARTRTIGRPGGVRAVITDLGASLVSLLVPSPDGGMLDVVLGFEDVERYGNNPAHLGAVVGRVANRIGGARYTLDGRVVRLPVFERGNYLHGGPHFWHDRAWRFVEEGLDRVTLALESPDGDQGFPGAVHARVSYEVRDGSLLIDYECEADARTPINLTNHSYFNLNGQGSGSVAGHRVQVLADEITATCDDLVPTGALLPVAGTPLDLRNPCELRHGLEAGLARKEPERGFDHNYVLRDFSPCADRVGEIRLVASVWGDVSGIRMDVLSDLPGLQLYSANYLDESQGKGGSAYRPHDAVCLETQFFPDALNHPEFAQPVFGPGHPFVSTTEFRFS